MKELEQKILEKGVVLPGDVLKVGAFLNQLIDTDLLKKMAEETANLFSNQKITKVLTIESSGLPFATAVAMRLSVPMIYAKKSASSNMTNDVYFAEVFSYTHGKLFKIRIGKEYISSDDVVLITDDFLASGNALKGLISLVEAAGAKVAGIAIEIEKQYQGGGDELRANGFKVESLAKIASMQEGRIVFCD